MERRLEKVAVRGTKVCSRGWEKAGIASSSTSTVDGCATTVETSSRSIKDIDINGDGMMDIYVAMADSLDLKNRRLYGPTFISGFLRERVCPGLNEVLRGDKTKKVKKVSSDRS